MQQKSDLHIFKGLQVDNDPTKQPSEFLVDAKNIRLTTREKGGMLCVTSEKGTSKLHIFINNKESNIEGVIVGHCIIGDYLVLFTSKDNDTTNIYRFRSIGKDAINGDCIISNIDLGITKTTKLETLGVYENNNIQKVYWVDGVHQPRFINIVADNLDGAAFDNLDVSSFDFVRELQLKEEVSVLKQSASGGLFPACSIQYAFSYYKKYGQESNLAWISPIYFTGKADRGGSPEETIGNSFKISIKNVDHNFDYLRLYSIKRTSESGTPEVKIVKDIALHTATEKDIVIDVSTKQKTLIYKRAKRLEADQGAYLEDYTFSTDDGETWVTAEAFFSNYTRRELSSKVSGLSGTITGYEVTGKPGLQWKNRRDGILGVDKSYSGSIFFLTDYANSGLYEEADNLIGVAQEEFLMFTIDSIGNITNNLYYIYVDIKDVPETEVVRYNTVVIEDTNTIGETIDPTVLLYVGGEEIIAGCITQKDGTLFLGDIAISRPSIKAHTLPATINSSTKDVYTLEGTTKYIYRRYNSLDWFSDSNKTMSESPKTFKAKEVYRLGIQLQYKNGKWSDPIFVGDSSNNAYPTLSTNKITIPTFSSSINLSQYISQGYRKVRPVVVIPSLAERRVIAQGFICPSLTNKKNVADKKIPTNQAAWFITGGGLGIEEGAAGYSPDDLFSTNASILTMYSPDIEFDESLWNLDYSSSNLRLVGSASINGNWADLSIETSSPAIKYDGFKKSSYGTDDFKSNNLAYGYWYDDAVIDKDDDGDYVANNQITKGGTSDKIYNRGTYKVYAWQSSGSLNNDETRPADKGTRTAVLKKKVISNIKDIGVSYGGATTDYSSYVNIQLFTDDQVSLIKTGNSYYDTYYGNVDTAIDTVIYTKRLKMWQSNYETSVFSPTRRADAKADYDSFSHKLIRMRYKSCPHGVITLTQKTLQGIAFAEIYKASSNYDKFADDSDYTLQSHKWYPAGKATSILNGYTPVVWEYGDCYYQRYDCLRIYPFTNEDENQIVDIISFMCETRVNIDGRYDRNRGLSSNLNIRPTNFNLINKAYTQDDSFFTYRMLDKDYSVLSNFDTSVMWSTQKNEASEIDNWTNITLANMLTLDGTKGKLQSLQTYNDNIFAFQDTGISRILFNSRTQINTTDGVPIEISNNYKVDGSLYISDVQGCDNKQKLVKSPSGIYFADTISKELCILNGNGVTPVSSTKGMSSWFKGNTVNSLYYDNIYNDVYINSGTTALVYSELLGAFTSFMDYQDAKNMFNFKNSFLAYTDNNVLWSMNTGDNCDIFGTTRDYRLSFISNADPYVDKVFTNIELRTDFLNNSSYQHNNFFDNINVTNEYQDTGIKPIVTSRRFDNSKEASSRKKFRIWRIDVPRNANSRDRIRNYWSKFTLSKNVNKNTNSIDTLNLHDLDVVYYI